MQVALENLVKEAYLSKVRDHLGLHVLKNQFAVRNSTSFPSNAEMILVYRKLVQNGELPDDRDFMNMAEVIKDLKEY